MGKLVFRTTLVFAAILLVFQNCGNDANFTQDVQGSSAVALNEELDSGDQDVDLGVIDQTCDTLPRKNTTINVKFPKPGYTCKFGEDGNLSRLDAFFRARIEQRVSLGLPVGAVICDAAFDFKPQAFRYDDYFALLFNRNIITSGYDFRDDLPAENFGLLAYSWGGLSGIRMDFGSRKEQVYCPQIPGAAANCSFPGHDTQGIIDLDLDSKYIRAVMSNGIPADHSFTLVTFGDNDDLDCEHSDVEFDVNVTYVLSQ